MDQTSAENSTPERTPEKRAASVQGEESNPSTDSPELLAQVESFDALLANQQTALKDLLQNPLSTNEEDDDLADELEDLARSEELLRRELTGVSGIQAPSPLRSPSPGIARRNNETTPPRRGPDVIPPDTVESAPVIPAAPAAAAVAATSPVFIGNVVDPFSTEQAAEDDDNKLVHGSAVQENDVVTLGLRISPSPGHTILKEARDQSTPQQITPDAIPPSETTTQFAVSAAVVDERAATRDKNKEPSMPSSPPSTTTTTTTTVDGILRDLATAGGDGKVSPDSSSWEDIDNQNNVIIEEEEPRQIIQDVIPSKTTEVVKSAEEQTLRSTSEGPPVPTPTKSVDGILRDLAHGEKEILPDSNLNDGDDKDVTMEEAEPAKKSANVYEDYVQQDEGNHDDDSNIRERKRSWEEFGPGWTESEEQAQPPPGNSSMELDYFTKHPDVDPLFAPRLEESFPPYTSGPGRLTPASEVNEVPLTLKDIMMDDTELIDTGMMEVDAESQEEDVLGELHDLSMANSNDNIVSVDSGLVSTETPLRSNKTKKVENMDAAPSFPRAEPSGVQPLVATTVEASSGGDSMHALYDSLLNAKNSSEEADLEVSGWTGVLKPATRVALESGGEDRPPSSVDNYSMGDTTSSKDTEKSTTLAMMLQSTLVFPPQEDVDFCDSSIGSHDILNTSSEDASLDELPPMYHGDFDPREASTPEPKMPAAKNEDKPIESMTIVMGSFEAGSPVVGPGGSGDNVHLPSEGDSLPPRWSPTSSNASQSSDNVAAVAAVASNSLLKKENEYPEFDYYKQTSSGEGGRGSPGRSTSKSVISSEGLVSFASARENTASVATGDNDSFATAEAASRVTATTGTHTIGTFDTAQQDEDEQEIKFTYSDDRVQASADDVSGPGSESSDSPVQIFTDTEVGTTPERIRRSPGSDGMDAGYKQISDSESSQSDIEDQRTKKRGCQYVFAILAVIIFCGAIIAAAVIVRLRRDDRSSVDRTVDAGETPSLSPSPTPSLRSRQPSVLPSPSPTQTPSKENVNIFPGQPSKAPSNEPVASASPSAALSTSSPTFLVPSIAPSDQTLLTLLISKSFDGGESLRNQTSPQFAAYTWLTSNGNLDEYSDDKVVQRYVLATLYYSTGGDGWLQSSSWLTDEDECFWVSRSRRSLCDRQGRAKELDLALNDLEGSIPPEIGLLSNSLEHIDLCGGPQKKLSGTIPSEVGLLSDLVQLRLSDNLLSGSIPAQISRLDRLELLDLNANQLRGPLPAGIGRLIDLKNMNLVGNQLSGPLPTSLGSLRELSTLLLTDNMFEGPLPSTIGQLNRLRTFTAGNNGFTEIATEIGLLDSLVFLFLEGNEFEGPLPSEIGNMQTLRYLSVSKNSFNGTIPTELGKLRLLNELDLSENEFTGSIPAELGLINSRMRVLKLNSNMLQGPVPELFDKLNRVNTVMLQDNMLTGVMPAAVCDVFESTFPAVHIDCDEVECSCCNFCCENDAKDEECACRFLGTDKEWMCY